MGALFFQKFFATYVTYGALRPLASGLRGLQGRFSVQKRVWRRS